MVRDQKFSLSADIERFSLLNCRVLYPPSNRAPRASLLNWIAKQYNWNWALLVACSITHKATLRTLLASVWIIKAWRDPVKRLDLKTPEDVWRCETDGRTPWNLFFSPPRRRTCGLPTPGGATACPARAAAQCSGPTRCLCTRPHKPCFCSSSKVRSLTHVTHVPTNPASVPAARYTRYKRKESFSPTGIKLCFIPMDCTCMYVALKHWAI